MAAIQFWADGFRTYYGWGVICDYCHGHIHPMCSPDPAPDCEVCNGMGGSPQKLCPIVDIRLDTYGELLRLGQGQFHPSNKIKPNQLLVALAIIESGLVDRPNSLDAAWAVRDLKDIAQLASELETDIAISW